MAHPDSDSTPQERPEAVPATGEGSSVGPGSDPDAGSDADAGPEAEAGSLAERLRRGDQHAYDLLTERVYAELLRIARAHMSRQAAGHTLQPTALVHEVFLKLASSERRVADEAHLLNLAARAMRQVLVDHARRRSTQRRKVPGERVPLDSILDAYDARAGDLLELEDLLESLESVDPDLVSMVELRFYGGRTTEQIAEIQGRSVRDVERRWQGLRLILKKELSDQ